MRKALLLFAVLLICGIAGVFPMRSYMLEQKDQVRITENVVHGDPAFVSGVTVKIGSQMEHRLYWDTIYTIGEQPVTEYRYYSSKYYETGVRGEYSGVRFEGFPNYGSSGSGIESVGEETGFGDAYRELAEQLPAGTSGSKRIYVKDYYEYYPVWVSIETEYFDQDYCEGFWMGSHNVVDETEMKKVSEAFRSFFKVPVLEDEIYVIELTKNRAGDVVEIGGQSNGLRDDIEADGFYWQTATAWDENYCYFTFVPYSAMGKEVDTSLIPGGFGIYRLPFYQDEEGMYHVKAEELTMVYALEPESVKGELHLESGQQGEVLLVTGNENQLCYQTIRTDIWELKQEFFIEKEAEDRVTLWHREEDFMVWVIGERLLVVSESEERGYEKQIFIPLKEGSLIWEGAQSYRGQGAVDWNGKQLLYAVHGVAAETKYLHGVAYDCDVSIGIYDETGEVYRGEYLSSLHADKEREEKHVYDGGQCESRDYVLEVQWGN